MNQSSNLAHRMGVWTALALVLGFANPVCAASTYTETNLVSDGFLPAAHTDSNLVNAWGLALNPFAVAWVANNGTGTSTLYDGNGVAASLIVTIPTPDADTGGNP